MKNIIIFLTLVNFAFAASAMNGLIDFKQADGSTFKGKLKGDEWFSWVEDSQSNIIKYNIKSKNYEYAKITTTNGNKNLAPSGIKVMENRKSNNSSMPNGTKINKKTLSEIWKSRRNRAIKHAHKRYE